MKELITPTQLFMVRFNFYQKIYLSRQYLMDNFLVGKKTEIGIRVSLNPLDQASGETQYQPDFKWKRMAVDKGNINGPIKLSAKLV